MTSAFSWQNSISFCPASFRIAHLTKIEFSALISEDVWIYLNQIRLRVELSSNGLQNDARSRPSELSERLPPGLEVLRSFAE